MTLDDERRIRLSFGQVAWGIAVLIALVGQWIRFEVRLTTLERIVGEQRAYTRGETDLMHSEFNHRLERLERHFR